MLIRLCLISFIILLGCGGGGSSSAPSLTSEVLINVVYVRNSDLPALPEYKARLIAKELPAYFSNKINGKIKINRFITIQDPMPYPADISDQFTGNRFSSWKNYLTGLEDADIVLILDKPMTDKNDLGSIYIGGRANGFCVSSYAVAHVGDGLFADIAYNMSKHTTFHELGHLLGATHKAYTYNLMSPNWPEDRSPINLFRFLAETGKEINSCMLGKRSHEEHNCTFANRIERKAS